MHKIKEVMAKSREQGMQTFDQHLFDLYEAGTISLEEALRNADSKNELRLRVKLESKRAEKNLDDGLSGISMMDDDDALIASQKSGGH